jgi:hypothetical protein
MPNAMAASQRHSRKTSTTANGFRNSVGLPGDKSHVEAVQRDPAHQVLVGGWNVGI